VKVLWGHAGPVAFRGYFDRGLPLGMWRAMRGDLRESGDPALVERALRQYGARRIVVGHTPARSVRAMYGGRLVAICGNQVGVDVVDASSEVSMLHIEDGRLNVLGLSGRRQPLS
jgi:hypothetical protein